MAISTSIQSLTAAFSNGTLFTAASGALFVYFNANGSTIFQDGRRLVLALFFFFATLWAQVDFANLMIESSSACQVALFFSTGADQLARVTLLQFLLWSSGNSAKVTAGRLILQGLLLVRLVAGGILIGFTRPELDPVCIAHTSLLPVAIVVPSLDVIIMGVMVIRSLGQQGKGPMSMASHDKERSRALAFIGAGFLFWSATSVMMLLGILGTAIILRTTLPSFGFLVLIILVLVFFPALLPQEQKLVTPEATSPFMSNGHATRDMFRQTQARSLAVEHSYSNSGSPFIENPSTTSRENASGYHTNQSQIQGSSKLGPGVMPRTVAIEQEHINNAPGYKGSSGILATEWHTAGVDRPAAAPVARVAPETKAPNKAAASSTQPKRSLLNWGSKPAPSAVGKLGISNPIMETPENESSSKQPFARMQTIDLATAAENDRLRREAAAVRSKLVANRSAQNTLTPGLSTQKELEQSVSAKCKQAPSQQLATMEKMESSGASGLSVDPNTGNSTSASLSLGKDDVRRRSPRSLNTFGSPENSEKPLARRFPSNRVPGLPANPRATRMIKAQEPKVMLVNDVVYDHLEVANSMAESAPSSYAKRRKEVDEDGDVMPNTALKSGSGSVLHRPRPYKQDPELEQSRAIYPGETSPHHKRSKSGSSISRKSLILDSQSGSPTKLLPLPPVPTNASGLARILSNNTNGMTFDEKIEFLFPAPPSAQPMMKRRSSVPSLPRVPSAYLSETSRVQSTVQEDQRSQRASRRNTITSFALPEQSESPSNPTGQVAAGSSARSIADEVGDTWIPGLDAAALNDISFRQSLQRTAAKTMLDSSENRKSIYAVASSHLTSPGSTLFWRSVHSGTSAVDLSMAKRNDNSMVVRDISSQNKPPPPVSGLPAIYGKEMSMVELDQVESPTALAPFNINRDSFLLDENQSPENDKVAALPTWHRRVGDELLTFSERKVVSRARKMPPPAPLLLNTNGRTTAVVVRLAEPSPPSDEPEKAIAEIQEQLKRFEESSRGSIHSILRHLPNDQATNKSTSEQSDNRLRLLENLEMEMGVQENRWQQMQINLDRNSMSTTMSSSPSYPEDSNVSQRSSLGSTRRSSRIMSRRARVRASLAQSNNQETDSTFFTASSDNYRASAWQQRLAEAHIQYLENAPALLSQKQNVNFLSVTKNRMGSLESTTPPESIDSGSDFTESESEAEIGEKTSTVSSVAALWKMAPPPPKAAIGRLWMAPFEKSPIAGTSKLPARNMRPATRTALPSLSIYTSRLWCKSASPLKGLASVGLWQSKYLRAKLTEQRRVTQRPNRKSKRVTFLPDIVESPKPLPYKRDTLGIYQFPWGETSDSALFQPFVAPPILASSAKFDAKSGDLELDEYSSSFFDDYDMEDMDSNSDSQSEEESDDEFDETTLWEIASLLKTENVPSRESMFLSQTEMTEYDVDSEYEEKSDDSDLIDGESFSINLSILPLATALDAAITSRTKLWARMPTSSTTSQLHGLAQPDVTIWNNLVASADASTQTRRHAEASMVPAALETNELWGLQQSAQSSKSHPALWAASTSEQTGEVLAPPIALELLTSAVFVPQKKAETMPRKAAAPLWKQNTQRSSVQLTPLFSTQNTRSSFRTTQALPVAQDMIKASRVVPDTMLSIYSESLWQPKKTFAQLWTAKAKSHAAVESGLFEANIDRSQFRTTTLIPAAVNMVAAPRRISTPLAIVSTGGLWSRASVEPEHHWITESSVRCESPSVYSESSSGESSPTSDATSVKSSSTKASSIWGSINNNTWLTTKRTAKPEAPASSEVPKIFFKVPVLKKVPSKPLESVRESRVLASRDVWEATAPPTLSDIPARKPITRQQQKPILPFRANWDEALAKAVAAGTPRLVRPVANASDWEVALSRAIIRGQPKLQRPNVTAAEWDAALIIATATEVVMPAKESGNGLWAMTRNHSKAIRPCLMWSSTVKESDLFSGLVYGTVRKSGISDSTDLPVLESKSLWHSSFKSVTLKNWISSHRVETASTWAAPVVQSKANTTSGVVLWSANEKRLSIFKSANEDAVFIRKTVPSTSTDLPLLATTGTWAATNDSTAERNWIAASTAATADRQMKTLPTTWLSPELRTVVQETEHVTLWLANEKRASMFSSKKDGSAFVRKATIPSSSALATLTTDAIWEPMAAEAIDYNWITVNKAIPIAPTAVPEPAQTWTPGSGPEQRILVSTVVPSTSSDMFAHIQRLPVKRIASSRPATLARLKSNELFQLDASHDQVTHWLNAMSNIASSSLNESRSNPATQHMWTIRASIEEKIPLMFTVVPSFFPDMFADVKSSSSKYSARSQALLPYLFSNELFTAKTGVPKATHWLEISSIPQVAKLKSDSAKASMWVAQGPKDEKVLLYTIVPSFSSDMFSKIRYTTVKKVSTRLESLASLTSNHLFAPTRSTTQVTHWLRASSVI
ncbi:hypothetical protein BJ878DRAFT_560907 [Calycina marina]|uniref:Uncharacterized protein n=1 Tax=Calycina marina TaxID=1763456 RepID=A0A9P8CIZ9_9HELO|nr:hypothetical protein BJ878DRAFT_560907 [Calycina marina]